MATATYPVRLREWVRQGEEVVCPECKGLRWIAPLIWVEEMKDFAAVTIDCTWCHGRGWVLKDEGDGRGYDRRIG